MFAMNSGELRVQREMLRNMEAKQRHALPE
jgi:hypothetical protein